MSKQKKGQQNLPQVNDLYKPLIQALINLGGSGNIEEINERVYEIMNLSPEILNIPHGTDGRTEVEYKLAWTRTFLKKYGLLNNSSRGIWALTKANISLKDIDPSEIDKTTREKFKAKNNSEKTLKTNEIGH